MGLNKVATHPCFDEQVLLRLMVTISDLASKNHHSGICSKDKQIPKHQSVSHETYPTKQRATTPFSNHDTKIMQNILKHHQQQPTAPGKQIKPVQRDPPAVGNRQPTLRHPEEKRATGPSRPTCNRENSEYYDHSLVIQYTTKLSFIGLPFCIFSEGAAG